MYLLLIQQVLLNTYYLPGIVLGPGDSAMNKADPGVCDLVKKKKKKMSVHKEKGAFSSWWTQPQIKVLSLGSGGRGWTSASHPSLG